MHYALQHALPLSLDRDIQHARCDMYMLFRRRRLQLVACTAHGATDFDSKRVPCLIHIVDARPPFSNYYLRVHAGFACSHVFTAKPVACRFVRIGDDSFEIQSVALRCKQRGCMPFLYIDMILTCLQVVCGRRHYDDARSLQTDAAPGGFILF
jgi:hypothetical protein